SAGRSPGPAGRDSTWWMNDPDTLASRLLKLEQQLSAYEKLHADELTELRQALDQYKREAANPAASRPPAVPAIRAADGRDMEAPMADHHLPARVARGDRRLLDGATGSELQHRGVSVSKGMAADGTVLGAWSATAMVDAPEVVRAIHEDYLRVGADIVTA